MLWKKTNHDHLGMLPKISSSKFPPVLEFQFFWLYFLSGTKRTQILHCLGPPEFCTVHYVRAALPSFPFSPPICISALYHWAHIPIDILLWKEACLKWLRLRVYDCIKMIIFPWWVIKAQEQMWAPDKMPSKNKLKGIIHTILSRGFSAVFYQV